MIDSEIRALFRCPRSGQPLVLDDDAATVEEINQKLAEGSVSLATGERPSEPVEALYRTANSEVRYPVIRGIPFLLDEMALEPAGELAVTPGLDLGMSEFQRRQMTIYSQRYEKYYGGPGGITQAVQRALQKRFYNRLENSTVLDIGNGGTPSEKQLGETMASRLSSFIALDRSFHMLARHGIFGNQVLGDALRIPLLNDTVDYILVNNAFHHFGVHRGQNPVETMRRFFTEALRVSRKGIIGVELVIPRIAENMEWALLRAVKFLPTFVFSESFYRETFRELGLQVGDFESRKIHQLVSPFYVSPPVLELYWLRLPAILVPYSFLFFSIDKPGGERG